MFKKLRGVQLSYRKQALIYYTCLDFYGQPVEVRDKIMRLCHEAAGGYSSALFEHMTRGTGMRRICEKYYVTATPMYGVRKRFYEMW